MAAQSSRASAKRENESVERGAKQLKNVAEYQRVHVWNMPRARSASVRRAHRKKKLRNLRQTVRGSMRRVHVNTGMLNKRALYWLMLVSSYLCKELTYVRVCNVNRLLLQH
jgi:hypothetical protein